MNTSDRKLVESFVASMEECIRIFSNGRLSDAEIKFLAECEVNRLDFANDWQMHKGIGFFAKKAIENYLQRKTAQILIKLYIQSNRITFIFYYSIFRLTFDSNYSLFRFYWNDKYLFVRNSLPFKKYWNFPYFCYNIIEQRRLWSFGS